MFPSRASSSMTQLDSVTCSPAGGSSPVDVGSLPTLSRETSSLGTDLSSPYSSGAWPAEFNPEDFTWVEQDLTSHTSHKFSWSGFMPVEEGYTLWSDSYNSANSSYCTFDQCLTTHNSPGLSPASQTAQLAADLLNLDKDIALSTARSPSNKKLSIPRAKVSQKEKPRHACPDCGKSCVRPSDLLRHKQDVHGQAAQYYQCEAQQCTYNTRRKDKMKEHCQKMHGHTKRAEHFATISGGNHLVDDGSPLAKRQRR